MQRARRAVLILGLAFAADACGGSAKPSPEPPPTLAPTLAPVPPPTTVAPSPVPTAAATATPVATSAPVPARTPVPRSPAASPGPTSAPPTLATPAPVDHARVAKLVAEGEAAFAAGKLAEADALFDGALAQDAGSAAARKGKARTATTRLGLARTFVPDISSSEGAGGKVKELEGFDDVEDLNVKRAVRVPGRAELDSTRGHLKPGETYTVSIFLRNQSKKRKRIIKLANVNVHRIVNDKDSVVEISWNKVDVPPKQRVLVGTLTGPWEDDVSSWVLQVRLLSESGDIYENRLVWK